MKFDERMDINNNGDARMLLLPKPAEAVVIIL